MPKSIPSTTFHKQLITSYEQLAKLYIDFENQNESRTSIFNSFIWLNIWYKTYWKNNWRLRCIAYFDENKLICLAPFYVQKSTSFPFINSLHLIGQGEDEIKEVSAEYLDIQITPDYVKKIYSRLVDDIQEIHFDTLILKAIFDHSHIANIVSLFQGNFSRRKCCQYIINSNIWSIDNTSKNTRSRIKRSHNQLKKLNAKVRWLLEDELESHWLLLKNFHQQRWNNKGLAGAFISPEFNQFHLSLIRENRNSVAMSAIFIDNIPIAVNYYLTDNNNCYFYQSGWDQENYTKLSPGFYLHFWSIEHCPRTYYDFMMGGVNDSYKAKFSGQKTPMQSFVYIKNKQKYFLNRVIIKIKKILRF